MRPWASVAASARQRRQSRPVAARKSDGDRWSGEAQDSSSSLPRAFLSDVVMAVPPLHRCSLQPLAKPDPRRSLRSSSVSVPARRCLAPRGATSSLPLVDSIQLGSKLWWPTSCSRRRSNRRPGLRSVPRRGSGVVPGAGDSGGRPHRTRRRRGHHDSHHVSILLFPLSLRAASRFTSMNSQITSVAVRTPARRNLLRPLGFRSLFQLAVLAT